MERWTGLLRVKINPLNGPHFTVAASLCLSTSSKSLAVPTINAIFFTGDKVEGTGNSVIERLSNKRNIAEILVSKFSKLGVFVNAWVFEASVFNGPFAVYKEFIPSVNSWGEPKCYDYVGFPASSSMVSLLSKCLEEVKKVITGGDQETCQARLSSSFLHQAKTVVFGFSKGGIVLNQILAELAHTKLQSHPNLVTKDTLRENCSEAWEESQVIPSSKESLLSSISEIHYVDVGLNSAGAYLTDNSIIERVADHVVHGADGFRVALHGTPRQWGDSRRSWITNEKERLLQLLEVAAQKTAGKIQVCQRLYFGNNPPNLQMHFEIIEKLDVS